MLESQLVMEKLMHVLANTSVGTLLIYAFLQKRHFRFITILHEYGLPCIRSLEQRLVLYYQQISSVVL